MYAFGQFVQDTNDNKKTLENIYDKMGKTNMNTPINSPTQNTTEQSSKIVEEKNDTTKKYISDNKTVVKNANKIHIYDAPGSSCTLEDHRRYAEELRFIELDTTNGYWKMDNIIGEKAFYCKHCNSLITYESDVKNVL